MRDVHILLSSLTSVQNDRMFDIANVAFDNVSDEEKQAYTTSFEKIGQYQGYKPPKQWVCLISLMPDS